MIRKLLLPLAAALVMAVPSSATILILSAPTVTPLGGGLFDWTYNVTLGPLSTLDAPGAPCSSPIPGTVCDGLLTIYDFAGYQAGSVSTTMTDWTAGVALLGVTPAGIVPAADSAILNNLTFAYTGGPQSAGAGGLFLGTVSATSSQGVPTLGNYAGRSGLDLGTGSNIRSANLDVTTVPGVPEPGTVTLLGGALLGLAALRRRRNS